MKKFTKITALVVMLVLVGLLAGCGGGSAAKRITGLAPAAVVETFFNLVKSSSTNDATAYVSPASRSDVKAVMNLSSLSEIKNSNLLSAKVVAQQGNYAVVSATMQAKDSFKISVKPVGLEKIDGEWYLVDFDSIANNAKYQVLQGLMSKIANI